jgi:hypothetical protein
MHVLLSQKEGVLISYDEGGKWNEFNRGLPEGIVPLRVTLDSDGSLYLTSLGSGLFKSHKPYTAWQSLNSVDFQTRRKNGVGGAYRKISAFAVDPSNPDTLALATKHAIYRSRDGGSSWARQPMSSLEQTRYFTALAFSGDRDTLYAGTSFNGIYRIGGAGSLSLSSGLPWEPYTEDLGFHEEITALARDPDNPSTVYAGLNFGGGLYVSVNGGASWTHIPLPFEKESCFEVSDIALRKDAVYVATNGGVLRIDRQRKNCSALDHNIRVPSDAWPLGLLVIDESGTVPPLFRSLGRPMLGGRNDLRIRAEGKKALYASVPSVTTRLSSIMSTIRQCGMNAVVIDMKDDYGKIHFRSSNSAAREIGAIRNSIDVPALLKTLKKEGVYAIARIVTFKDGTLYRAYGNRYAIRDSVTGGPWTGGNREYWVDPHSEFVQEYNIAIARELELLGFDEVQFDYIRFPADGPVHRCRYPYRERGDIFKSEVIADFLSRARESLGIPVSVDVYGFTAWYQFGNWIGQDMEDIARTADVICPMVYPSHFGTRFYKKLTAEEHPYRIVRDSGTRSRLLSGGDSIIRPYLQAFNMRSPTWGPGYLRVQVKGAEESGCSGYIFWNAAGEYAKVREAFADGRGMK